MSEPAELSLTQVAAAIRRRKLSSVELTTRLARTDRALAARAQRVRARGGRRCSGGLPRRPIARSRARAEGTAAWRPARPQGHVLLGGASRRLRLQDARGLDRPRHRPPRSTRLEAAGSFRLGALHLAEFAYGPTGHNSYLGPARNPWDPSRITGGSSSGSGCRGRSAPRSVRRSAPTPAARSACRRISAA